MKEHKSTFHAIGKIVRNEGVLSVYNGSVEFVFNMFGYDEAHTTDYLQDSFGKQLTVLLDLECTNLF